MTDNLGLVKKHGLKVLFTLFSFECADVDNCFNIIDNADKQEKYMTNGLKPFLDHINKTGFGDQIFAISMFNEPEWMIAGTGGSIKRKVDLNKLQQFTTLANAEIKKWGFNATVSSASLKWSCKKGKWCEGDWWAESGQSFRTVHYYGWMSQGGAEFDPFSTTPMDWGLEGENVLIGESPGYTDDSLKHGKITVSNQFFLANHLGWKGVLPWPTAAMEINSDIDAGLRCYDKLWNGCSVNS